jgi:hypothetical protein
MEQILNKDNANEICGIIKTMLRNSSQLSIHSKYIGKVRPEIEVLGKNRQLYKTGTSTIHYGDCIIESDFDKDMQLIRICWDKGYVYEWEKGKTIPFGTKITTSEFDIRYEEKHSLGYDMLTIISSTD